MEFLLMPLTSRMYLQSMREILGDLRTFPGVFDLVVGDITNVSRDIMKYVRCRTHQTGPCSLVSGDHESRRNRDPTISTTIRVAGPCLTRGP